MNVLAVEPKAWGLPVYSTLFSANVSLASPLASSFCASPECHVWQEDSQIDILGRASIFNETVVQCTFPSAEMAHLSQAAASISLHCDKSMRGMMGGATHVPLFQSSAMRVDAGATIFPTVDPMTGRRTCRSTYLVSSTSGSTSGLALAGELITGAGVVRATKTACTDCVRGVCRCYSIFGALRSCSGILTVGVIDAEGNIYAHANDRPTLQDASQFIASAPTRAYGSVPSYSRTQWSL